MEIIINGKKHKIKNVYIDFAFEDCAIDFNEARKSIANEDVFELEFVGKVISKITNYKSGYFQDTIDKNSKIEFTEIYK